MGQVILTSPEVVKKIATTCWCTVNKRQYIVTADMEDNIVASLNQLEDCKWKLILNSGLAILLIIIKTSFYKIAIVFRLRISGLCMYVRSSSCNCE